MKIKLHSDDELPLNKTIEIPSMTIVLRAVFMKIKKCYPQVFLDQYLHCLYCHYWYFLNKGFKFQPNVCNRCHDLLMMSMNLSDIAILCIKNADYHSIITGISKSEAIKLLQNIDLTEKSGTL